MGGGWWVVAYSILVSAPVPFVFRSYWDLVLVGPRVWGQGLTILDSGYRYSVCLAKIESAYYSDERLWEAWNTPHLILTTSVKYSSYQKENTQKHLANSVIHITPSTTL